MAKGKIILIQALGLVLCLFPLTSCTSAVEAYLVEGKLLADSFLARNPDQLITYEEERGRHKWHYEQGLMLHTLYEVYQSTGDSRYLDFIIGNLDHYVDSTGQIATYKPQTYKLDDVTPGRALIEVFVKSGGDRFRLAADHIHDQLRQQPRTREGGFWHKQIYPYQMWLDGLYMAGPFSALYARQFQLPAEFDDVVNQFVWAESHLRDPRTGLMYHGWDESKSEIWADPETGRSSSFWSRGMGWYLMALVDVLDYLPPDHAGIPVLVKQLNQLSQAVLTYRNPQSLLWYQVTDKGDSTGNYLESSASAMFIYAFAKGVRQGHLPESYLKAAQASFQSFNAQFITRDADGRASIHQTCSSAGLGGKQQRDGSYAYYLSEPIRSNDCKAIGPYILAALELGKQNSNEQ